MGKKLTIEEFIDRAKKVHGDKYDYSKSNYNKSDYIGKRVKFDIICLIHGSFLQNPNDHLTGRGCKKCWGNLSSIKQRSNINNFIEKSIKIHGNKYEYTHCNYINAHTKIEIICKLHGSFWQLPLNHLKGKGCSKCTNNCKSTLEEFIYKSNLIHKNKWDYSNSIYINDITKVEIICKQHGSFLQTPRSHLNNSGCPKCSLSKGELKILNFLQNNKIDFIYQKTFDDCRNPKTNCKLSYDFYIPSKNLLIEYDGIQHYTTDSFNNWNNNYFKLENIKYKDSVKTNYAILHGIMLYRIKYTDIKNIDVILQSLKLNT